MLAVNAFAAYVTNGKETEIVKERYIDRVEWIRAFTRNNDAEKPVINTQSAVEQAHDLFKQIKRKGGNKNRPVNTISQTNA